MVAQGSFRVYKAEQFSKGCTGHQSGDDAVHKIQNSVALVSVEDQNVLSENDYVVWGADA